LPADTSSRVPTPSSSPCPSSVRSRGTEDHRDHPRAGGDREDPEAPGPGPAAPAQGPGARGGAGLRPSEHRPARAGRHQHRIRRLQHRNAAATQPGRGCALSGRGLTVPTSTLRSRPGLPQAKRRGGPKSALATAQPPDSSHRG
jgi:hypothetical protein